LLRIADYSQCVGIAGHLLFEQFVHTNIWARRVRVIPIAQQLASLTLSQDLFLCRPFRLEGLQRGSRGYPSLQDLLRTGSSERKIMGDALRIIHVFISCLRAVNRLRDPVSRFVGKVQNGNAG
jgi:hypothetical protein